MQDELQRLEKWYADQCDGEWEHDRGVALETLDNPGWCLRVDLRGTDAQARQFDALNVERGEGDWVRAEVAETVFTGYCGPRNLRELVRVLMEFVAYPYRDGEMHRASELTDAGGVDAQVGAGSSDIRPSSALNRYRLTAVNAALFEPLHFEGNAPAIGFYRTYEVVAASLMDVVAYVAADLRDQQAALVDLGECEVLETDVSGQPGIAEASGRAFFAADSEE